MMLTKTTVSTDSILPHTLSARYKLHVYLNTAPSDTLPTLTSNRMKTFLSPLHCCLTLNASQLQRSHQGEYQPITGHQITGESKIHWPCFTSLCG